MERTIKFLLFIVLVIICTILRVKADEETISLVTPQTVDFNICTKTFALSQEKLFYLSIASANANRFTIEEIQSKTGYILFSAANKQYLASVVKVDNAHSQLKITPTNNSYFFPPGVVLNFFKYIDLNTSAQMVNVPKV